MIIDKTIDKEMDVAIRSGVFPSAQLLVNKGGQIVHEGYYGQARANTHFDIASLTKPMSTVTLAMQLVTEGLLKLDDTVYSWLGGARQPAHKKITVKHLLNHSSGLPAWQPYYREVPLDMVGTPEGKQMILDACYEEPLVEEIGFQSTYSDIGFIMLGEIIEQAGITTLDTLFTNRISTPLKLKDTFFVRIIGTVFGKTKTTYEKMIERRFAPTEDCPWREKVLHGEVHDPHSFAMGGAAGHAGLFSTAQDLNKFITEFVRCYRGESDFIPQETVRQFLCFDEKLTYKKSSWLLGWDTPSPKNSSSGKYFSSESIGHLGYTGCSVWIDLKKDFWVILLTNRVHPSDTNQKIKLFRPHIHDVIFESLIK